MLSKFAVKLDEIRRAYERNAQRYHYRRASRHAIDAMNRLRAQGLA